MNTLAAPDPAGIERRRFLFGGLLLAGAAAGMAVRPRPTAPTFDPGAFDASVPKQLGPYRFASVSGVVLPPRDELSLQTYDQYLARTYVAEGLPPVNLLIAYGGVQDYALQVHRPESCYPASGYTIGESRSVLLDHPRIEAVTLPARRGRYHQRILYWTRIGESYPASLWSERWVILRSALLQRAPDGVIVRLSTIDDPDALAALRRFNALLLAGIGPVARRIMLGAIA